MRREAVPLSDRPVVEVVRRRDLHAAGAEFLVDVAVGDHADRAAGERQRHFLADELGIAPVVGIHGDRDVAQHRLGPRRRDDDITLAIDTRIADLPDLALLLLVLDLEVGHGGAELRIPVDEALAAIDEPVVEQPHECFDDCGGEPLVHREALARPVARRAEAAHLVRDRRAGFLLPLPDALDEFLAADLEPRRAFDLELVLDDDLRRDAGMIGAELPQRVAAAHPLPADQHVHQRVLERVPHVQRAGDVGRRQLDAIGRRAVLPRRLEVAARFPQRVPLRLDGGGFEAFREFHGVMNG